ncbi:VWA domain-containing protein [Candidatus Pacearchaeota archaeon]|nr:VWA domain-containing protein [Candidatus Pacearchaeota archaeon]
MGIKKIKLINGKRGYFFSLDAFLALVIIFGVILFIKPTVKHVDYEESIHEDLLLALSSVAIADLNNSYAETLRSSGAITNQNQSVLDQIGEFYANSDTRANTLADSILNELDLDKNIGIYFGDSEIAKIEIIPYASAETISTSRQIISGIQQGNATKGYSSRAFLFANKRVDYFYFGGYVGDGNISVIINGTVLGVNVEGVFSKNFDVYINNVFAGNHSPAANIPYKFSLADQLSKFVPGENIVEFRSTQENLYVAGGFIKVVYDSYDINEGKTKFFPGVEGLINLYDSFYVPSVVKKMDILLHYNSSYDIFMTIGNKTVYQGNSSGSETSVILNDSYLKSILDTSGGLGVIKYPNLHDKTVPVRIGLSNASYYLNQSSYVDIISVTDISGSMDEDKITDAKNANIQLIDAILNYSGNNVGLAAYSTWAKKNDFHTLSNDSTSLKNEVNSWNAQDYTCICCGILKAVSCFDKNIFLDNFNGQTSGSNPIGWTIVEGNGVIDITSSSLEGDRAVNISRLSSQNPSMNHYFPPQQDKITTEFLVRHNSGTGTIRMEVEGANDGYSSLQDYIVLKMYGGWIRNVNAQIVSYNLNTIYKIRVEVVPGASTYDLYVNDALVGDNLAVYATRNNVARVFFTTENSNINYAVDDVKVFLTDEICDVPQGNRNRVAVVMSDGQANRDCGLNPVPDYDLDGDTDFDPSDQAIEAACIAKQKNITVHAVGFGNTADEETLQNIASCGSGSYYFADVGGLVDLYTQIANDVIKASYYEQTITGEGFSTRLYPDSYIKLSYQSTLPYGLVVFTETDIFNNPESQGSFYIPEDSTPYNGKVVSYSGAKWTSNVELYNQSSSTWKSFFNLGSYGLNFTNLGDPYMTEIPKSMIKTGNNTVRVFVGVSSSNYTAGSIYNKVIYSVIKEFSAYSPISPSADGCKWNIEFEDGSTIIMSVPSNYSGPDQCHYQSGNMFDPDGSTDAIELAIFSLLRKLDLNSNGKIETKFSDNDLTLDTSEITGIPFSWDTEVQIRTWS